MAVWIWNRKFFNILSNEAAATCIKFIVKAKVVKFFNKSGVADSTSQPQKICLIYFFTYKPVTIAINNRATQVNPEGRFLGNISEDKLRLIPGTRVLGNPYFVPFPPRFNHVLAPFQGVSDRK